jgi:adenylate cyclase
MRRRAINILTIRVTRDLTTSLGRWRIAKVASLGLAASYKGKPFDPRSMGRELNGLYLVEGDVRSTAEKVTVTTRLVDAGSGTQAWNDQQELSREQAAKGPGTLLGYPIFDFGLCLVEARFGIGLGHRSRRSLYSSEFSGATGNRRNTCGGKLSPAGALRD